MRYESDYYAYNPYNPATSLRQHGILGMKWGVWNAETRARYMGSGSKSKWFSKITDRFNKPKEEPHLKRTHLTKELAEISDAELNAAIKRMRLEQDYLQMLNNYPDASDKGKKYANQFADELFKNLTTGLGGSLGRRIAKGIDDWINDDEARSKAEKEEAEKRKAKELDKKLQKELDDKTDKDITVYNKRKEIEEKYKKYRKEELGK